MAKMAKTSTINRTALLPHPEVSRYCHDLENWPRSWMGWEKDLPPGERLVACFRLFIQHVASSGLSPKTIRRRGQPLAARRRDHPGFEPNPSLRRVGAERLLTDLIHEDGGPLINNGSEEEQRSFDSTCRKLHRLLTQSHL